MEKSIIDKGLIVSCQAESDSWFNKPDRIVGLAIESERGGCVGLRVCGINNIKEVKKNINLPVIGLIKSKYDDGSVWITKSLENALKLEDVGCNYVAVDGTGRNGYTEFEKILNKIKVPIIADISNIEQAIEVNKLGCGLISTTLSGYYNENVEFDYKPDMDLVKEITDKLNNVIVIAEGRYWTREQVKQAYKNGANNVVIGSAITRPHLVTKYFSKC